MNEGKGLGNSPWMRLLWRGATFLTLAAIMVAPVWLVRYPPLVDYPNHLARAYILAHLTDPGSGLEQFYARAWGPNPYLMMDGILFILQQIIAIEPAGRVLLSLCLLAIPAAAWFFLREANPESEYNFVWSALIAYSPFFLSGFINYCLSISICFLGLGLWLRFLALARTERWLFAMLAATALYFTHIVAFAVMGFVIAAYMILTRQRIRRFVHGCLLFVPGIVFYLVWNAKAGRTPFLFPSLGEKLVGLAEPLRGYSKSLDILTVAALALCFAGAVGRNRDLRWNRRWLAVSALLPVLYLVSPEIQGTFLFLRLTPFLFVLFLATAQVGPRARSVAVVALLLFVLRVGHVGLHFASVQAEMAGLARSFAFIPPRARVLPIVESWREPLPLRHYAHFWAYGVIQKGWFCPHLFHARGILPAPLRLVPDAYAPPGFGWLDYTTEPDWSSVQREYDYVWAYHVPRYQAPLSDIGDLIFENGNLRVFRLHAATLSP